MPSLITSLQTQFPYRLTPINKESEVNVMKYLATYISYLIDLKL